MKTTGRLIWIMAWMVGAACFAGAQGIAQYQSPSVRIIRSNDGRPLTAPSQSAPLAIVTQALRARGTDEATLNSLVFVSEGRNARAGRRTVELEQRLGGLELYGGYIKAVLTASGEVVQIIDATAAARTVRPVLVTPQQALQSALRQLFPELASTPGLVRQSGNTAEFAGGVFFQANPTVTLVAAPFSDGSARAAYLVETWSRRRNQLHHTLVSGDGSVLDVELRTAADAYNVFTENPLVTPQAVVQGPGAGNTQSPAGWLFSGNQTTTNIAGNNVYAYLDVNADDLPDAGGTTVSNGQFVTPANLSAEPATDQNRNVAVQNLFYFNNVVHDVLYTHGFVEGTGNFQEDNFGKGGRAGDSVNAEAQDGGGTDNANFATPRDGSNPRMQMYLWSGQGTHNVVVHTPASIAGTYLAQGADFGPPLDATGVVGDVQLVNDGTGTATDACEAIPAGSLNGKIALIDRGTCSFAVKVQNAGAAGAVGAIVANNSGDSIMTMGGDGMTNPTIPAVFVGQTDGQTLRSVTGVNATIKLASPPPLHRDGTIDSDVVFHEYGHGLTWRMIGGMRGAMSGAIGEGMSDVLAVILNDDDRVGEYSFSDPKGLRRYPYTNYPLTYGDFTGDEVHNDGEIYGAIGWRLWEIFQQNRLSKDLLLDYLVDGMNFTPSRPAFEDMRDGILQATSGTGHECLVWQAFAAYGVGVGATSDVRPRGVTITESFELPSSCGPTVSVSNRR